MSLRRGLLWLLIAIPVVLAVMVAFAPASMADWALDRATAGRLRLADGQGSLWQGQGRVVLVDVKPAELAGAQAAARPEQILRGLALPGTLRWQVRAMPLLLGLVEAQLSLDGMTQPLRLSGSFGELRGSASSLSLPVLDLGRLGSPWNTIRPSAGIGVQWNDFTLKQGLFEGNMSIELRDAASAMTPVRPLGTYRVAVASAGRQADVTLATAKGPLNLSGKGRWSARSGLQFTAEAWPDASERERLQSMLNLVGRREGDRVIIKIGA